MASARINLLLLLLYLIYIARFFFCTFYCCVYFLGPNAADCAAGVSFVVGVVTLCQLLRSQSLSGTFFSVFRCVRGENFS